MDVWAYLAQREKELKGLSVSPDIIRISAEKGSDAQRGRLLARAWLNDRAFLEVHELVCVIDGRITRERYAYFLCIDGVEIGGYERDPTHSPAEHKHCSHRGEHRRSAAPAISFKKAAEEAWDYVSGLYDEDDEEQ